MSSKSASVWDEIGQEVFLGKNESEPFNSSGEANTTGEVAIPNPELPVKIEQETTKGCSSSTDETGGKSGGGNSNLKQTAMGTGGGGDGVATSSSTPALSSNNNANNNNNASPETAITTVGGYVIESNWTEQVESFDAMGLKDELLRGINAKYEKPTLIQQRAIRPIILGRDVIAQASFSAGKTAAYAIGILQSINTELKPCQAIILTSYRELVVNIVETISTIGQCMGVRVHVFVGGISIREDMKALHEGVHIAVGTSGRMHDLIQKRVLVLDSVKHFVLDEADVVLSRNLDDQVREIIRYIPPSVHCAVFSATIPAEVEEFAEKFMQDPIRIIVKKEKLTLETSCRQFYVSMDSDEHKLERLCDLYKNLTITAAIIYCNTSQRVEWLTQRLKDRNFSVSSIHYGTAYLERGVILREFMSGSSRVLVSTSLFVQGVYFPPVSLVINYDLPCPIEAYIGHIARSFRPGQKAVYISFVVDRDMRSIEHFYNTQIEEIPANINELI